MTKTFITVVNWSKYHSNSDKVRNPNFMKVNLDIFSSESLLELNPAQKWFSLYLVRQCTRKWSDTFEFSMSHATKMTGVDAKDIKQAIEILKQNGTLSVNCQQNVSEETIVGLEDVSSKTQSRVDQSRVDQILVEETSTEGMIEPQLKKEGKKKEKELHQILEVWNKACAPLAKVKELNPKRKALCEKYWSKNSDPSVWERQIKEFAAHKHNQGLNDRGWKATFDFFIRPEIQTRIVEGYYSNKKTKFVPDFRSEADH